jgi:hypothetical protein
MASGAPGRAVPDGPVPGALRAGGGVDLAAPAARRVLAVLGDLRACLRDVVLLVAVDHAQAVRAGQVAPALAPAPREPVLLVVRVLDPGQVRPPRAWPLALGAVRLAAAAGLVLGRVRPGSSSVDGGLEEFPESRESRRSTLASLAANASLALTSSAI